MQMKFNPLYRSFIRANRLFCPHNIPGFQNHIVIIFRVVNFPLNNQVATRRYLSKDTLVIIRTKKTGHTDTVCVIRHIERQYCASTFLEGSAGNGKDIPLNGHPPGFKRQCFHGNRLLTDTAPHQNFAGLRPGSLDRSRRGRTLSGFSLFHSWIIRHNFRSLQRIKLKDSVFKLCQLNWGRHGGKPGRNTHAAFRYMDLNLRHICLLQSSRQKMKVSAVRKYC